MDVEVKAFNEFAGRRRRRRNCLRQHYTELKRIAHTAACITLTCVRRDGHAIAPA